jgi:hypothetical protein
MILGVNGMSSMAGRKELKMRSAWKEILLLDSIVRFGLFSLHPPEDSLR